MTLAERNVLGGLLLLGLVPVALVEMYDTTSVVLRIGLVLVNLAISFVVLRATLERLGVQRDRLIPTAVWGLLGWSVIPFSHMAFIGYLLIPIEVGLGATLVSFRGNLSMARALLSVLVAHVVARAATVSLHDLCVRALS